MKEGVLNLTAKQGVPLTLRLAWRDQSGTLVDLTGWQAVLVAKVSYSSPVAALTCRSDGAQPQITLCGTPWNIEVQAPPEAVNALRPGRHVYDLVLTDPTGEPWPLVGGDLTVRGSAVP